jgi:hypothetical protein
VRSRDLQTKTRNRFDGKLGREETGEGGKRCRIARHIETIIAATIIVIFSITIICLLSIQIAKKDAVTIRKLQM